MEPHLFFDQINVLKFIMKHNCLSGHLKFIGESSLKLCYFKIKSLDNTVKSYRSAGLVNDQRQYKCHVELDIFQHQTQPHILNQHNLLINFNERS